MKKAFISLLMLLMIVSAGFAQKEIEEEPKSNNFPMSIGPFMTFKGGVNTNHPDGIENAPIFLGMPDIGATFYIPFTDKNKLGATIDLAYTTVGYGRHIYKDDENVWDETFNYIALSPNLHIHGFMIGFNFGLPLGGTVNEIDADAEDLAFLIEGKLSGLIPIYANDFGRVNLIITAAYTITGVYSDDVDNNPHPVTAGIGFSYLFNLTSP